MNAQQIIDSTHPSVAYAYATKIYGKTLQPKKKLLFIKRVEGDWRIDLKSK